MRYLKEEMGKQYLEQSQHDNTKSNLLGEKDIEAMVLKVSLEVRQERKTSAVVRQ
jgi:hypothetical protein